MANFDVKKSNRKCYESDRAFQPGEEFISALLESENGQTERRDFGLEHWNEPPENCIGWWKCSVPETGKGKIYWAPKQVLIAYFEHVRTHKATLDIAYVAGLLLSQKRILKLVDDGGDNSIIRLQDHSTKTVYEIPVEEISPERLVEIQNELSEKLFMDQPMDYENDPDSDLKLDSEEE